jgi:hypothetical protein
MLNKQQAKNLIPIVNNPQIWEALQEHLKHLKTLEVQVLAVATSEQEMFRSQGKLRLVVHLEQLKDEVLEAINRKED